MEAPVVVRGFGMLPEAVHDIVEEELPRVLK